MVEPRTSDSARHARRQHEVSSPVRVLSARPGSRRETGARHAGIRQIADPDLRPDAVAHPAATEAHPDCSPGDIGDGVKLRGQHAPGPRSAPRPQFGRARTRHGGPSGRVRRGAACRTGRCCWPMRVGFPGGKTPSVQHRPSGRRGSSAGQNPPGHDTQGQPVANVGGLPGNAGGKTPWCATVVSRRRQTASRSPLFPKRKLRPPGRNQ